MWCRQAWTSQIPVPPKPQDVHVCLLYVYFMSTLCLLYVCPLFHVYCMSTLCLLYVYFMSTLSFGTRTLDLPKLLPPKKLSNLTSDLRNSRPREMLHPSYLHFKPQASQKLLTPLILFLFSSAPLLAPGVTRPAACSRRHTPRWWVVVAMIGCGVGGPGGEAGGGCNRRHSKLRPIKARRCRLVRTRRRLVRGRRRLHQLRSRRRCLLRQMRGQRHNAKPGGLSFHSRLLRRLGRRIHLRHMRGRPLELGRLDRRRGRRLLWRESPNSFWRRLDRRPSLQEAGIILPPCICAVVCAAASLAARRLSVRNRRHATAVVCAAAGLAARRPTVSCRRHATSA